MKIPVVVQGTPLLSRQAMPTTNGRSAVAGDAAHARRSRSTAGGRSGVPTQTAAGPTALAYTSQI